MGSLGSLFGKGRAPLARAPGKKKEKGQAPTRNVAKTVRKQRSTGTFDIDWRKQDRRQVINSRTGLQLEDIVVFLKKGKITGYASFDWEISDSEKSSA